MPNDKPHYHIKFMDVMGYYFYIDIRDNTSVYVYKWDRIPYGRSGNLIEAIIRLVSSHKFNPSEFAKFVLNILPEKGQE